MDNTVTYIYPKTQASSIRGPRKLRLLVWPVDEVPFLGTVPVSPQPDWTPGNAALEIISDGSRATISMSVVVEKSINAIPNATTVTLYNLAEGTRALFAPRASGSLKCILYMQDPYTTVFQEIFSGGLVSCISQRQGADVVTTLYILQKVIVGMTSATTTSANLVSLNDILKPVVAKLGLSKLRIDRAFGATIVNSFSHMGNVRDMLTKLAFQEGFSWTIVNEELRIIQDFNLTGGVVSITPDTGLISAVPILSGPMYIMCGVLVKAYPIPYLECGDRFLVQSEINSIQCNRPNWGVVNIKHSLSTFENQWEMEVTSYDCNLNGLTGKRT